MISSLTRNRHSLAGVSHMTSHKDVKICFDIGNRRFEAVGFPIEDAQGERLSLQEVLRYAAKENGGAIGLNDFNYIHAALSRLVIQDYSESYGHPDDPKFDQRGRPRPLVTRADGRDVPVYRSYASPRHLCCTGCYANCLPPEIYKYTLLTGPVICSWRSMDPSTPSISVKFYWCSSSDQWRTIIQEEFVGDRAYYGEETLVLRRL